MFLSSIARRFRSSTGAKDAMWNEFVAPHRKTYTMHYIDIGQGEPVVMAHGMLLSTYTLDTLI
jgi:hypothetical protein